MSTDLTADLTVSTSAQMPTTNEGREIAAVVAVGRLIRLYPDVPLTTIRLEVQGEHVTDTHVVAYGVRPQCPSCHVRPGEVHTEYCHTRKHMTGAGRAMCSTCTPTAENLEYPGQPGVRTDRP